MGENMQALHSHDEFASESSEITGQQSGNAPWRKTAAVVTGLALFVAAIGVMSTSSREPHDSQAADYLVNLQEATCSEAHENCMSTGCCANTGYKCYMKNQWWANCNATCNTDYIDAWDKSQNVTAGWNCSEVQKPDETSCAEDHEDCTGNPNCCDGHNGAKLICFVKAEGWSNCNPTCKFTDNDYDKGGNWSCEIHEMKCPKL